MMKYPVTLVCIFFSAVTLLFSQSEDVGLRWVATSHSLGLGSSFVDDMAVDNDGNTYIAGHVGSSTNFYDVLVYKISSQGKTLWHDTIQGTADKQDIANSIDIDNNGDIVVFGRSDEPSPIVGSVFLAKYSPDGARIWQKRYKGPFENGIISLANSVIDNAGNIYITAVALYNPNSLIVKFNSSGEVQWEKSIEMVNSNGITLDNNSNVYITGQEIGLARPAAVTIKYDAEGNTLWSNSHGSDENEGAIGTDIAVDAFGNVFNLAIYTHDNLSNSAKLFKYSANGTLEWSKAIGGYIWEPGQALAVDATGNAYVIVEKPAEQSSSLILLTKIDPSGKEAWSYPYSGAQVDQGLDRPTYIMIDKNQNIYVTSGTFNTTPYFKTMETIKFDTAGTVIWAEIYHNSSFAASISGERVFAVPSGDIYVAGQGNMSGNGSIWVTKYTPPIANIEKPVTQPGTYVFNASGNNTAITITFNTVSGTGTVNVSYFGFPAVNLEFDGSTPINISQYKWVIDALGLTGIDAEIKIALDMLQNNGGVIDPNDVKIFKREIEGSGAFKELATKFENGELKASITGFSEFILGSATSPLLVEEEGGTLPNNIALLESFPEPFKTSTKIRFALPHSSFVKLSVHDSFGRQIGTLVNEQLPEGNFYYQFNAENLPAGVYFYTLSTGKFTETKKMVLVR
jgi:hypothetical protein